jgi:hypothetical protein
MLRRKSLIIFALAFAIVALFTYTEAYAIADGDGICESSEEASNDCVNFDGNSLEFRGSLNGFATLADGVTIKPATFYFFLYNGGATNQLNSLIPLFLGDGLNYESGATGCQQVILETGDPTTGFGENDYTRYVCRMANNLASLPTDITPPGDANIWIATDPSITAFPMAVQLRQSKNNVWGGAINGPSLEAGTVVRTGGTLTAEDGTQATYEMQGNTPVYVSTGRLLPLDHFKLCVPKASATDPYSFPGDYDCENIAYMDHECNIKTTGTDPFTGLGDWGFVW